MKARERANGGADGHADDVQTGDEERREGHGRKQQLGEGVVHDDRDGVVDRRLTVADRQIHITSPT